MKPSLHDRFNSKVYFPGKYLNPYGCQRSRFQSPGQVEGVTDKEAVAVNYTGRARINYGAGRHTRTAARSLTLRQDVKGFTLAGAGETVSTKVSNDAAADPN